MTNINDIEDHIEFTPYLASSYVEGFGEGESASIFEQLQAWAYLIRTGLCWSLQGFYGRMAEDLIDGGLISKDGNCIDYEAVEIHEL